MMFSTNSIEDLFSTASSYVEIGGSEEISEIQNWGKRSVAVLQRSKQSFKNFFTHVFASSLQWGREGLIDQIKCFAFFLFLNLSWILDSDLCRTLPGRLVILWSSRAMSLLLFGYVKDVISIGQKVFSFRGVVDKDSSEVGCFKRESDELHSEVLSLIETSQGIQKNIVKLCKTEGDMEQSIRDMEQSVACVGSVATDFRATIEDAKSAILKIEALNGEQARLNEKSISIMLGYKKAAKRFEKAFVTMKFALSLALISPTTNPIIFNGRSLNARQILSAMQIAERLLKKA